MIQTLAALQSRPRRHPRKGGHSLETFIAQKLRACPYRDVQSVRYHCHGGIVLLTGVLPSFFMKQMAQECIRHIAGVSEIDNQVEVIYAERSGKCVH